MNYRLAGRTGVRVSALGFGAMSFGGDADEAASAAMFHRCRELGINLYDTADVYEDGRSEQILGRLIRDSGCRDDVVLSTKAYYPTGRDPNARGSSRRHLIAAVEASLRRLATDRIDFFYLHRWDDATSIEVTMRAIDDLVSQGKILYAGASNFAAWQVARTIGVCDRRGWSPPMFIQPMYNLVKRQAEVELFELARAESLAVFVYGPLGGGLLAGRYAGARRPATGRLVDLESYRLRYGEPAYYEIAEKFCALAADIGVHPASLAVAWAASHPAVTAPLLGARSLAQLEPSLAALEIDMTPELRARISALSPAPPPATDRSEESRIDSPFR